MHNPIFRWNEKVTLLVFVRTEGGLTGVGEAWCAAGSPLPIQSFIEEDLRSTIVGMDAALVEGLLREIRYKSRMSSRKSETDKALSGIDIALWDIKAQAAKLPLWRMLGGNDPMVSSYASGGLYREGQSPEEFAAVHAQQIEAGFAGIKIKVGGAKLASDIARVRALRNTIGAGPDLMIDGVASLNVPSAIRLARALTEFDIKWFEQPLANENLEGLVRVRTAGGIPIAGNENESGLDSFRRLIGSGGVDYVQFDPVISGGLTEGRKIAALAEAAHLPVSLHHSNSVVSMLANIHLAAAIPNCDSIEFHMVHRWFFEELPQGLLKVTAGKLCAPEIPGLGCDLSSHAPW